MISRVEEAARVAFHDAHLHALRVDLDRATVTLDLDVYVDDTEETAPCTAVFEGVTSVAMDPISLGLGGRVDVGDEVDGPDGAVWVFVDRSNGFVRLRAARVTMRVAGREGTARAE